MYTEHTNPNSATAIKCFQATLGRLHSNVPYDRIILDQFFIKTMAPLLPDLIWETIFRKLPIKDQLTVCKMSDRGARLVRAANRHVKTIVICNWFTPKEIEKKVNSLSLASTPSMQLALATGGNQFAPFDDYPITTVHPSKWAYLKLRRCQLLDSDTVESLVNAFSAVTDLKFFGDESVSCKNLTALLQHSQWLLTTGTRFELMEINDIDEIDSNVNVEITFRESVDNWNLNCHFLPIVNNAEVLCQQMANAMAFIPADVTLKTMTDERLFPAHKFVLKLRSSVFAAMFSGDFVENQAEKPIEIFELSGQVMEAMLAYIYCRSFNGWKEIAGELAVAADMYDIQPLYKLCTGILWSKITINNAVNNFYYADLLNLTSKKLKIARFIVENKKNIEETESWKEITEERRDWLKKQFLTWATANTRRLGPYSLRLQSPWRRALAVAQMKPDLAALCRATLTYIYLTVSQMSNRGAQLVRAANRHVNNNGHLKLAFSRKHKMQF
ncbi:hypothetical protein TYRP_023553 [Tyrophagus putrescentiae]|nr:hypothetical protein TYRP_023553 [Tyrophagus putrescentiae]